MRLFIFFITVLLVTGIAKAEKLPVVFKKGMLITCPANHKPVYKVVNTIREGSAITSLDIVYYGTGKHPKPKEPFLCHSVISVPWRGVCMHSNQGWLPKACQVGLRVELKIDPVVE